ncbi:MAG: sigma-70 family RNA polymerase sigma factor [Myxococcales bacterium]
MPQELDPQTLIEQGLAGDATCLRSLVDRLSPLIARRVAATLWRVKTNRNVRQDAADMIQDVFLALFQNDGKALRAWDPERGMSLDSFIGLLTQHQVISILRSRVTTPWREELADMEEIQDIDTSPVTPEALFSSRENLSTLLERVRETLSPRGLELFQRMFVDEESIEHLGTATGMTPDALYQWRSRLHRTIRALAGEINAPAASDRGTRTRMLKRIPGT